VISPQTTTSVTNGIPVTPASRWVRPFVRFLHVESASGFLLLGCTIVALVLANSPWAAGYAEIWLTPIRLSIGSFELNKPLLLWINDGLMTIFFFVIGLEIKRELVHGELRSPRKAALPIVAALGGMLVPAMVYLMLQWGQPGQAGWAVPVATDIAFVVGFLALFGKRVPPGLKILLLTLAIADDIGAVLIIAFFYSTHISIPALGMAALGFCLTYFLNRIGVRQVGIYVVIGAGIWLAFLKSGIHPTVAGVLLGLLTPARAWVGDRALTDVLADTLHRLRGTSDDGIPLRRQPDLGGVALIVREGIAPLERLETGLHPWVGFFIMPLFAFANAGVAIEVDGLASPIALAVAAGLAFGKPIGVVLFCWLATKLGLTRLPSGVNWKIVMAAGCLAGIGFTMSIFIGGLALKDSALTDAKIGTLTGSALSAIMGCVMLYFFLPKKSKTTAP